MSAAIVIVPTTITDAMLVSCTIAEPDTGETPWDAGTSWTVGQYVIRTTTHRRYKNLIAGINATLPEVAALEVSPRWLDVGPTNRWAQFDRKIGTSSAVATTMTTVIKPGSAEGLALLELVGRRVDITAVDRSGGIEIYSRSINLDATQIDSVYDWMFNERVQRSNVVFVDLPGQYPRMEITVTVTSTEGASIGVLAAGRAHNIGSTERGAGAGIINFGSVKNDGFGGRDWEEGDFARRVTLPIQGTWDDYNRIDRLLTKQRSTPCIYIGSQLETMEPLLAYGVYRDLYITVPQFPITRMNLEVEGLSNS